MLRADSRMRLGQQLLTVSTVLGIAGHLLKKFVSINDAIKAAKEATAGSKAAGLMQRFLK